LLIVRNLSERESLTKGERRGQVKRLSDAKHPSIPDPGRRRHLLVAGEPEPLGRATSREKALVATHAGSGALRGVYLPFFGKTGEETLSKLEKCLA